VCFGVLPLIVYVYAGAGDAGYQVFYGRACVRAAPLLRAVFSPPICCASFPDITLCARFPDITRVLVHPARCWFPLNSRNL